MALTDSGVEGLPCCNPQHTELQCFQLHSPLPNTSTGLRADLRHQGQPCQKLWAQAGQKEHLTLSPWEGALDLKFPGDSLNLNPLCYQIFVHPFIHLHVFPVQRFWKS